MPEETFLEMLRVRGVVIFRLHPLVGSLNPELLLISSIF